MPTCPTCSASIPAEDVNVQQNVAYCRACDRATRLSDLAVREEPRSLVDPAKPPKGAWFVDNGGEMLVGATTRHFGFLFMIPFAVVWSGGSLGMLYGSQIASGKFDPVFSLIGLPFLIGSIALWSATAMAVCGKTEVRIRGGDGEVFTGVGRLGLRRRFCVSDVAKVYEQQSMVRGPGMYGMGIVLEGQSRLVFGRSLNEARRHFVVEMLRVLILGAEFGKAGSSGR